VVSLASGRVVAIHARLGDTVQKGQLLLTIRSDDVSGGYSNYRMAVADEILAGLSTSAPRICTSTAPSP
jgi:membrane fusion protein, heavy metal efflux system